MSTPHVPALQEVTFLVVGGVTDAPGFKIVSDGHGGFKIVPVPGWNPEQSLELGAALSVLSKAGRFKNAEASQAILTAAAKVAVTEVAKMAGATKGTTVVIAA